MNSNQNQKRNILLLVAATIINFMVYYGGKGIAWGLPHANLTTAIDDAIPLWPPMVIFYGGAYFFWLVNYYLSIKNDESGYNRYFIAHVIGELTCLAVFILLPTTMVRPEVTGTSFFDNILRWIYELDRPNNLLPSIHCFASWLGWIGVRKNAHVPKWYRYVSLAIAIAICASTVTVKQHIIVDVAAGIILAELSYLVAGAFSAIKGRRNRENGV